MLECRVLLLDMLLGNPDRLPCGRLMWAGNSGNMLAGCDARLNCVSSRLMYAATCWV
jgi:hypothetical protein